jgi:hypothetical protein
MVFIKYQSAYEKHWQKMAYEKHWQKMAREIKKISDFSMEAKL